MSQDMRRAAVTAAAVLLAALPAASCGSSSLTGPSALTSIDALVAALREHGAAASKGEVLPLGLPCLSVPGQVVAVNSGQVNVFEYPTAAAAAADAVKVAPNGSGVRGGGCAALILWIAPPRFYKSGRLIVVYAGTAGDVLQPLEAVVGTPFTTW